MLAVDRRALWAADSAPTASIARRSRTAADPRSEREPHRRLARLRVRVFAERCRRDNAPARWPEPSPPMRASDVADIRDRRAAELRRAGHSPPRHDKLTLAVRATPNDRRHLVGEDSREQRQVARSIMRRAKPIADRGLAFSQAVEVAHRADAYGARRLASTRVVLAPFSPSG